MASIRTKSAFWASPPAGHLASTVGTHFDAGDADAEDPVERVSCRPDFLILCYPVITFLEESTHQGSRKNLLGENPDPELVHSYSNETQVTDRTPPTFLWHTNEDVGVPPENSVLFLSGAAESGRAGRVARLRKRASRRRLGQACTRYGRVVQRRRGLAPQSRRLADGVTNCFDRADYRIRSQTDAENSDHPLHYLSEGGQK